MDAYEKHLTEKLMADVGRKAEQLRRLADEIEREARRDVLAASEDRHEWSSYSRAMSQVVHAVTWGVANLNLSQLVEAAGEADIAHQAGKDTEPVTNTKTGAVKALDAMLGVAEGWAESAAQNEVDLDGRDRKPADEQVFFLDDIRRMVNDAADESGIAGPWKGGR